MRNKPPRGEGQDVISSVWDHPLPEEWWKETPRGYQITCIVLAGEGWKMENEDRDEYFFGEPDEFPF